MKRKLKILGEFVGHLAIGAAMFVALLLFGGGLNMLVHWFGPIIAPSLLTPHASGCKNSTASFR